jgi:hypothetical protein
VRKPAPAQPRRAAVHPPAATHPATAAPAQERPAEPTQAAVVGQRAPPPAPTIAPLTLRPFILPQRRLVILTICGGDARALCAGTPPGRERILKCLAAQPSRLSPPCYAALTRVSKGDR